MLWRTGSGELDVDEFFTAVRTDLGIGTDIMEDDELKRLFAEVDVDGGGEVDAKEFVAWLFAEEAEAKTKDAKRKRVKVRRSTAQTEKASAVT